MPILTIKKGKVVMNYSMVAMNSSTLIRNLSSGGQVIKQYLSELSKKNLVCWM